MAPNLALGKIIPGARETLSALKTQGFITGIISNTPWGSSRQMWQQQCEQLGLGQHVDHTVFCMDVGVRKPHPDIFHHAFTLAGVSPEESLFVGDDPVWDVAGARGVGMDVVLFDAQASQSATEEKVISSLNDIVEHVRES